MGRLFLLGAVLVFSIAGCTAGRSTDSLAGLQPDQPQAAWQSALPRPGDALRFAAATKVIDPAAPLHHSAGLNVADPATATAPAQQFEYAIYSAANCGPGAAAQSMVFNLDGSSGTVWLGVGNYAQQRWEFQPIAAPFSTWMEVSLPPGGQYYHGANNEYVFALLVWDGDTLSFDGAHVITQTSPVVAPGNWRVHNIENGPDYGKHSAVCLVGDKPVVAYTDDSRKEIRFAASAAITPSAAGDWAKHTLDDRADLGGSVDLALVQDRPCAVYEDTNRQDVYFASPDSPNPTALADWTVHNPDASGTNAPRLLEIDGHAALCYVAPMKLRFARTTAAGLPDGATDWEYHDIDSGAFYSYPQLALGGTTPRVAYQRAQSGDKELRYAYAADATGATWTVLTIDTCNVTYSNGVQLRLDGAGRPCIAYQDTDIVEFLRYATAGSANPAAAGDFAKITVWQQAQTHVGRYMGFEFYNGRPLFSFVNAGTGSVAGLNAAIATADAPSGNADFDFGLLDDANGYYVTEETNVVILQSGLPAIVYRSSDGLKFAYYVED